MNWEDDEEEVENSEQIQKKQKHLDDDSDNEKRKVRSPKEKFKDFKESISEADFKKVDHIEIEMLKNMVSDLDMDDIEFVAKIIN